MSEFKFFKLYGTIQYKILDKNNNIVEEKTIKNTDTLFARVASYSQPWNYLRSYITKVNLLDLFNVDNNQELYNLAKANHLICSKIPTCLDVGFSRIDDYNIKATMLYNNSSIETEYIYSIFSAKNSKNCMYSFFIFEPSIELQPGYSLSINYFIRFEEYFVSISTNETISNYNNTNTILVTNSKISQLIKKYKLSRSFIKKNFYNGFDANDFANTLSNPSYSISYNQVGDFFRNLYLIFMNDGNVGNTNFYMVDKVNYLYNSGGSWDCSFYYQYKQFVAINNQPHILNRVSYNITKQNNINCFLLIDRKIKTGYFDEQNKTFTYIPGTINIKPNIKKSLIDFPLLDNWDSIVAFTKSFPRKNYLYFNDGCGFINRYTHNNKIWYFVNWDIGDLPYITLILDKEITQIIIDGNSYSNVNPIYQETLTVEESESLNGYTLYYYRINLNDYINVNNQEFADIEIVCNGTLRISYCIRSNCYLYTTECFGSFNTDNLNNYRHLSYGSANAWDFNLYNIHILMVGKNDKDKIVLSLNDNTEFPICLQCYDNYNHHSPVWFKDGIIYDNSFSNVISTKQIDTNIKCLSPCGFVYDESKDMLYCFGNGSYRIANFLLHSGNTITRYNFYLTLNNFNIPISLPRANCMFLYRYYDSYNSSTPPFFNHLHEFYEISNSMNYTIDNLNFSIHNNVITSNFNLDFPDCSLNLTFNDSNVQPTFIKDEKLDIPLTSDYMMQIDSLENIIVTGEQKIENNKFDYFNKLIGKYEIYRLNKYSNSYPENTLPVDDKYAQQKSLVKINIPDYVYNLWNVRYFDDNVLQYRAIYFVEDLLIDYPNSTNNCFGVILQLPKTINGLEVEPRLVLLDNQIEIPFEYFENISGSNVTETNYIKLYIQQWRAYNFLFWRNKNSFLVYVYFKNKSVTNEPFIRSFKVTSPSSYLNRTRPIYGLLHSKYGRSSFDIPVKYAYYWDGSDAFFNIDSYMLEFKNKNDIANISIRKNIFKWNKNQLPAFISCINGMIAVANLGEDEKTIYEFLNVNPNNTNNKVIPKTFYLDAQDFGENNYRCLINKRENVDDKKIAVYYGWAYEPENRQANDLTTIYPIINVEKIRNVLGDNFKIKDKNGNEIEYYFVNGEEFYIDTHSISNTPTNYVMLNFSNRIPRNFNSGYNDVNVNENYGNELFMTAGYNWNKKNKYNISLNYYANIQPIYRNDTFRNWSFRMYETTDLLRIMQYYDSTFDVYPATIFNYSDSISYSVGRPYPIPGFMPSFWLDHIIKHNKPNIALDLVVFEKSDSPENTTTATINGKIVDSQFEIELVDVTGKVTVYEQINRKLLKSEINYIHTAHLICYNKAHIIFFPRGFHEVREYNKVRIIPKVETVSGDVKYYHYHVGLNKWIDITDKIQTQDDFINYGFNQDSINLYGHKLNQLVRDYMEDADTLSFVIALNSNCPYIYNGDWWTQISSTDKDEYAFTEVWGLSLEIDLNDENLYRTLEWCWIDVNTQQPITDISNKAAYEVTIGIKPAPTHWIKWEVTNSGSPYNLTFDKFIQIPLDVYTIQSSININGTIPNITGYNPYGFISNSICYWIFDSRDRKR